MFMANVVEAGNDPHLNVDKHGGTRHWYTFWRVSYNNVVYNATAHTLTCKGSGDEPCKTGSTANNGNDYEINGVVFDEGLINMKMDVMLDLVDQETLPDNSPSTGSVSKTYSLYDKAGVAHLVAFLAVWTEADWETGDAKIVVSTSIID